MKINELNMFQNLLGKAKGMFGGGGSTPGVGSAGLSREDQMAQKIFVDRFVSRGLNALNTAVQQGLLDPNKTAQPAAPSASTAVPAASPATPSASASPTAPPAAAAPSAPATPGAKPAGQSAKVKSPGNAAIPAGQKQGLPKNQVDADVAGVIGNLRRMQPTGTKPLPPNSKIYQEIQADLPKVSLNKDYLIRVGSQISKANAAGYDVKDLHTKFMGQLAKGTKQKTIAESRVYEIYQKLNEVSFRKALLNAGHDPLEVAKRLEKLLDKYEAQRKEKAEQEERMGLREVNPVAPAQSTAPSIGEWFEQNFMSKFLRGIDITSAKSQVDAILNRMPQSYAKGNLKKDLNDIAMIAWSLSDQGKGKDRDEV